MKTLKQLHSAVLKFEPNEEVGSRAYYAMLFLLVASQVGANFRRCWRFMKIKPYSHEYDIVHEFRGNLYRNGMWKHGKLYVSDWWDKKTGGVGFVCDTLVALGLIAKAQ